MLLTAEPSLQSPVLDIFKMAGYLHSGFSWLGLLRHCFSLGMVVHVFNSGNQEAEAGGSVSSRLTYTVNSRTTRAT